MSTISSFYVTGGNLPLDAPSYVERRADRELLEGLLAGEYCYVLHARQMGKSSLMVRTTTPQQGQHPQHPGSQRPPLSAQRLAW